MQVFSDLQGIRIAVEMEKRGEGFYRRAAKLTKDEKMLAMLSSLAADERQHTREFENLLEREGGPSDAPYDDEMNTYLSAVAADITFPGGLMALRDEGFSSPEAVLRGAIASEKDSILFYSELRMCTKDTDAQRIFSEIILQEQKHLGRLQAQLINILTSRTESR